MPKTDSLVNKPKISGLNRSVLPGPQNHVKMIVVLFYRSWAMFFFFFFLGGGAADRVFGYMLFGLQRPVGDLGKDAGWKPRGPGRQELSGVLRV